MESVEMANAIARAVLGLIAPYWSVLWAAAEEEYVGRRQDNAIV